MPLYYLLVAILLSVVACTNDDIAAISNVEEQTAEGITIQIDSSYFINKFGKNHAKIIFRNDEDSSLIFIEKNENNWISKILNINVNAYHPQFSPDGSKLAYGTVTEYAIGQSSLYVLDLNNRNSKPAKLNVPSASIPRWRVLENGDTVIVYVSSTEPDHTEEWKKTSTWQVPFRKGAFGKPEKIFDGSFNGGVAYDNSFAISGSPRLLMHRAQDSANIFIDLYNDELACNVSVARDSSKIFSFLDAAGMKGVNYTGEPNYWWHRYLFFMNQDGEIIKAIPSLPATVFDSPEWINIPNFEVAATTTIEGKTNQIVIVDVETAEVDLILVTDESKYQIMHPDVWIDPNF